MADLRQSAGEWLVCVDTGGTFTDCIGRDPNGHMHRAKVLSTSALRARVRHVLAPGRLEIDHSWAACDDFIAGMKAHALADGSAIGCVARFDADASIVEFETLPDSRGRRLLHAGEAIEFISPEPAPILAARLMTGTPAGAPLPPMAMRLATTRATNALLERRGAKVAFFVTEGFADLLHIGDQTRPHLFAQRIVKPQPLTNAVVEVHERLNAEGAIVRALDEARLRESAVRVRREGASDVAAVALMHSVSNPDHERRTARILSECGFEHVVISSDIAALIRFGPRAQTTVIEAYLQPLIETYLRDIARTLDDATSNSRGRAGSFQIMTSAGSLRTAKSFRASESLLSGPAGGVVGAAAAGRAAGHSRIIAFDMGGTSTDACRIDSDPHYRFEHTVGDATVLAPALAIETVAAGGGSICTFRNHRLCVGPESAGANPGPACYGKGGDDAPLTLTDVNLLLARLDARGFEIPLSVAAAEAALGRLLSSMGSAAPAREATATLLNGLLDIANERMADAIKQVSIREGYDPRDYALLAFGGAGGQHACALAERLGMNTIVMPADASLLSAVGLMHARPERFAQRQILNTLNLVASSLQLILDQLSEDAVSALEAEGIPRSECLVNRRIISLRLLGQDSTIAVELDEGEPRIEQITSAFEHRFEQVYAHRPPLDQKPIEVESIRVVASTRTVPEMPARPVETHTRPERSGVRRVHLDQAWREVAVYAWSDLAPGAEIDGPAVLEGRASTFVLATGWHASIDFAGTITARRAHAGDALAPASMRIVEPVHQELFAHRFMSIAREMGQMLERAALSTNVKERRDFSCALIDADGWLAASAPHLPVHLGALGACVRAVRDALPMTKGDVVITNHPAFGGSHLPDITLISPVFAHDGMLLGYVANRAHHAELGGARPGSMPPDARTLAEEGVVLHPQYLVKGGVEQFGQIESLLRAGAFPSRAVADNLADLHAQLAANHRGEQALQSLALTHGAAEILHHMRCLHERAATLARTALRRFPQQHFKAHERLDDGSDLRVTINLAADPSHWDFAGTSAQHAGNLNATPAIVRSAVMYVLRLLLAEDLPLNEGLLRDIDLNLPAGSLLNPGFDVDDSTRCPAVVGGNTEVSQRLVDLLLKALGLAACSQGTMNNCLFGNNAFSYYETVCGGSGACAEGPGADAVHTHMTNTRITDPEILERRFPVRLERFSVRRASGGEGQFRGGDGAVREITFLQPFSLSLLTQHRVERPFGIQGGRAGQTGRQRVVRANGETQPLRSIDGCEVMPGDRLILETPGGGGYGAAATA